MRSFTRPLLPVVLLLALAAAPGARAELDIGDPHVADGAIRFSPYTYHWAYSAEHKPVVSLALDVPVKAYPGMFIGSAFFTNSFGQPSVYAYAGQRFLRPFGLERVYWHYTVGMLYGYKTPYEDKVPLNYRGFSPGIVPSVGYQFNANTAFEIQILGSAGLMFSVSKDLY